MKHTHVMSSVETSANLTSELDGLVYGNTADATEQRGQCLALDVLHREEVTAVGLADVVNATNVLVTDLSGNSHFTMKARERSAIAQQMFRKKFKGDGLTEFEIVGAVDFTHSAFTQ